MASIKVDMGDLDELIRGLEKAQINAKDACIKAVDQASPILKQCLSKEITKSANRGYATGALAGSVSAMKAKENEYGVFSVVGPRGTDKNGVSNEEKLLWLENGTKRSRGGLMKRAGPIRSRAVSAAKGKCQRALEESINKFIDEAFE